MGSKTPPSRAPRGAADWTAIDAGLVELAAKITSTWTQAETLFRQSDDLRREARDRLRDGEKRGESSVAKWIELSRLLRDAKAKLEKTPGAWGRLFSKHRRQLPRGFSRPNCYRLIRIAKNPTLDDRRNLRLLPRGGWTPLEALADVKPEELQAAIDRGDVKPGMKLKQAKAFAKGATALESDPIDDAKEGLRKGFRFAYGKLKDAPAAMRAEVGRFAQKLVNEFFPVEA
jgi:hypothetical protein